MIDLGRVPAMSVSPQMMEWGSTATPFLGGPAQRLRRIGSRHRITVQMRPMRIEAEGRQWIARLMQAKREGARMRWPQVEFRAGAVGTPTARIATSGGTTLPITGGQPGATIRFGQWLSIAHGGRSYLYGVTTGVVLDDEGAADVGLSVPLRHLVDAGDAVELAAPVIEGVIEGDGFGWTVERSRTVGLSFTLMERA